MGTTQVEVIAHLAVLFARNSRKCVTPEISNSVVGGKARNSCNDVETGSSLLCKKEKVMKTIIYELSFV
jgi:hypothetical protein